MKTEPSADNEAHPLDTDRTRVEEATPKPLPRGIPPPNNRLPLRGRDYAAGDRGTGTRASTLAPVFEATT